MTDYWPQVIPAVSGLVGAIIGAGASLLGQHLSRRHEYREKKKAIAFALAAEIEGHLNLTERRNLVAAAKCQAQIARTGAKTDFRGWLAPDERARDPFPIFSANMSNIGMLGRSCSEIGTFYNQAAAVRMTILAMQDGQYSELTPDQTATLIENELDLWLETVVSGRRLVDQLRAVK